MDAPGPTSLYGYFGRADVSVESHFFVRLDGTIEQYIDTNVRADANRYANVRAVSIETEDEGNPNQRPWSQAQQDALVRLMDWLCEVHSVPRKQCPAWDAPGIGWHSMWGAPSNWTPATGKTCPGNARIPQCFDLIRRVAALENGGPLMALSDAEQAELLERVRAMHVGNWVSESGQGDLRWLQRIVTEVVSGPLARIEQAIAEGIVDVDEQQLAEAIVAAMPPENAQAVADAILVGLKERL